MSAEQEKFEQLRRLLVLKRHEQPPPGYFNTFSNQVIARIRAEAPCKDESWLETYFLQVPWLQKVWRVLEAKPALAGAFGVMVCVVIGFGVLYSEHGGKSMPQYPGLVADAPAIRIGLGAQSNPLIGNLVSSTGVVSAISGGGSLFGELPSPKIQPVVFTKPENN